MKKFLSVVMVVVLALSLGMAAFAADSVTEVPGGVKVPTSVTETVEGEEVVVELTTGTVAAGDKLTYTEAAKVLGSAVTAGKNVAVVSLFELTADREVTAANPLTVTFTVPQGTYVVLHKAGDKWEVVSDVTTGTSVTATFKSLSPVAIVKLTDRGASSPSELPDYDKPASSLTTPGTSSGNKGDTSPNTGMDSTIAFALAAVLMAGAVICATKKEA